MLGSPHTKGSTVSFVGADGRVVTKTDSVGLRGWTETVGWAAKAAGVRRLDRDVPVRVHVRFRFPQPKRSTRWCPTVRPDIDKLTRALLDALTGIAYEDDAQVVELFALKVYDFDARTIVTVSEMEIRLIDPRELV